MGVGAAAINGPSSSSSVPTLRRVGDAHDSITDEVGRGGSSASASSPYDRLLASTPLIYEGSYGAATPTPTHAFGAGAGSRASSIAGLVVGTPLAQNVYGFGGSFNAVAHRMPDEEDDADGGSVAGEYGGGYGGLSTANILLPDEDLLSAHARYQAQYTGQPQYSYGSPAVARGQARSAQRQQQQQQQQQRDEVGTPQRAAVSGARNSPANNSAMRFPLPRTPQQQAQLQSQVPNAAHWAASAGKPANAGNLGPMLFPNLGASSQQQQPQQQSYEPPYLSPPPLNASGRRGSGVADDIGVYGSSVTGTPAGASVGSHFGSAHMARAFGGMHPDAVAAATAAGAAAGGNGDGGAEVNGDGSFDDSDAFLSPYRVPRADAPPPRSNGGFGSPSDRAFGGFSR